MMEWKKYFIINSEEWKVTFKWCIIIGFIIGLIAGVGAIVMS